ncbi:MAG: sigma 54-interacting transcriptional regulator [Planctomycetota bacterium]
MSPAPSRARRRSRGRARTGGRRHALPRRDRRGAGRGPARPARLLGESGEVVAIGGTEGRRLDVRIVAATNRDLAAGVEAGRFRRDLYYRLNVFALTVPALRQRREDIPDLARRFAAEAGADPSALARVFETLAGRDWPGNVPGLRNGGAPLRLARRRDRRRVPADLGAGRTASAPEGELPPLRAAVADFERGYLRELLRRVGGNVSEAARRAAISRPTLHTKLQQLRIDPDRFHDSRSGGGDEVGVAAAAADRGRGKTAATAGVATAQPLGKPSRKSLARFTLSNVIPCES